METKRHQRTGYPIVYTSADSVFQIAAHEETIPLKQLYEICEKTRNRVCIEDHTVGRIIARPFIGKPGNYSRPPNIDVLNADLGKTIAEIFQINENNNKLNSESFYNLLK